LEEEEKEGEVGGGSERDSLLGGGRKTTIFGAVKETPAKNDNKKKSALFKKKKKNKNKKKKKSAKVGFAGEIRKHLGLTKPDNSAWVDFRSTDLKTGVVEKKGRILIGLEVLPISMTTRRPCGEGREEPNQFPFLPPPDNRVSMRQMMNPLFAIKALMGDVRSERAARTKTKIEANSIATPRT